MHHYAHTELMNVIYDKTCVTEYGDGYYDLNSIYKSLHGHPSNRPTEWLRKLREYDEISGEDRVGKTVVCEKTPDGTTRVAANLVRTVEYIGFIAPEVWQTIVLPLPPGIT